MHLVEALGPSDRHRFCPCSRRVRARAVPLRRHADNNRDMSTCVRSSARPPARWRCSTSVPRAHAAASHRSATSPLRRSAPRGRCSFGRCSQPRHSQWRSHRTRVLSCQSSITSCCQDQHPILVQRAADLLGHRLVLELSFAASGASHADTHLERNNEQWRHHGLCCERRFDLHGASRFVSLCAPPPSGRTEVRFSSVRRNQRLRLWCSFTSPVQPASRFQQRSALQALPWPTSPFKCVRTYSLV